MEFTPAIVYAQLVNEAYKTPPNNLDNRAGQVATTTWGGDTKFDVITTLYACDLATDASPEASKSTASVGLVLQKQDSGEAVIAFRGTEGIKEWVLDAHFATIPCPFLSSAGETEDGFSDMYTTVRAEQDPKTPSLIVALPRLAWKQKVASVTVCGHSLGGALATLATLDIAVNAPAPYHDVACYTYASPKTGNTQFAAKYDQMVENTVRIANELDLVPRLPWLGYEHVNGEFELKPFQIWPPKFFLQPNVYCEHILTSYVSLLSRGAGGPELPLNQLCGSTDGAFAELMRLVEDKWKHPEGLKQSFFESKGRGLH